jgi:hypothetical protein
VLKTYCQSHSRTYVREDRGPDPHATPGGSCRRSVLPFLAIHQSPCDLVKSVNITKLPAQHTPSNRMVITDIFEQRYPRCMRIPITRHRSRVWSSIAPVQSRIHRALDWSRSDALQRRYYSKAGRVIRMDVRGRCHCVGCRSWSQGSYRGRLVVDVKVVGRS